MKKAYSMPTITVEELQLDKPVASGCEADDQDMRNLIGFGYFSTDCQYDVDDPKHKAELNDTICYHSNVIKAFMS